MWHTYCPLGPEGAYDDRDPPPSLLQLLLDYGADINAADGDGRHPIHLASVYNHGGAVRLLLQKGADIDAADGEGRSALHTTASTCTPRAVELLLHHGADDTAADAAGKLPFHLALEAYWDELYDCKISLENKVAVLQLLDDQAASYSGALRMQHTEETERASISAGLAALITGAAAGLRRLYRAHDETEGHQQEMVAARQQQEVRLQHVVAARQHEAGRQKQMVAARQQEEERMQQLVVARQEDEGQLQRVREEADREDASEAARSA